MLSADGCAFLEQSELEKEAESDAEEREERNVLLGGGEAEKDAADEADVDHADNDE